MLKAECTTAMPQAAMVAFTKGKVDHGVQTVETNQEDGDADDVEVQVDHGGTAGILVCAHRRRSAR